MNAAVYRFSENQNIEKGKIISTSKTTLGMNPTRRPPLSSIDRNAQNRAHGLHSNVIGTSKKKGVAVKKVPSRGKRADKNKAKQSSNPTHEDKRQEEEKPGLLLKDVTCTWVFRERNNVTDCEGFETTLQHANPIHENAKVIIHEDSREESSLSQLFDEHRVNGMDLSSMNKAINNENKKGVGSGTSRFLEAPNEDFLSDEMDRMLTLELANPIDGLDSDSGEDEDLS